MFGFDRPAPKRPPRDTDAARRIDILTVYDQLGPLSRKAISESPIDLHVSGMLGTAPDTLIDFNSAQLGWVDDKLAEWITRTIAARTRMSPKDFMLVPRRVMNRVGETGRDGGPYP